MFGFLSALAVGYLTVTGVVTNSAIVARGLKRAFDAATRGDLRDARAQRGSALAAPALIAVSAVGAFVCDCIRGAGDLGEPVLHAFDGVERQSA